MKFNDRMKFEFNGQPRRCIKCGRPMRSVHSAKTTMVWCGWGDIEEGHELYRWKDWEPGLPPALALLQVGDSGPAERWALRAFSVVVAVAAVLLLLEILLG